MNLSILPTGKQKPAVRFSHFPTAWQAVLWRNWGIIPLEKLAIILNCKPEQLIEAAQQLGLEKDESLCKIWRQRGYQTIIRQNWHLLSYKQLLIALNWAPEKLAYILREDDFLWSKLGKFKPRLTPPQYAALSAKQLSQTNRLRMWHNQIRELLPEQRERPFDFLRNSYGGEIEFPKNNGLRLIYSYSALYGDPLLEDESDPYPERLLADYAASGINAVWMQAVLYSLTPWFGKSEYSKNWEIRVANLKNLVQRLKKHGIKLMLYLNEPRAMPNAFFNEHPGWRGIQCAGTPDIYAMCTSNSDLLQKLSCGVEELFSKVPGLGGAFCITMSENLTNCFSKYPTGKPDCPLCSKRNASEVIIEIIEAIENGVHRADPEADVIAWNWGWHSQWDEQVVAGLPTNVKLLMVSETNLETSCCEGIKGRVADYSISKPGPGPTFLRLAAKARQRDIPIIAKVQLNNTWENSAVPYIPVPGLIEEHLDNLRRIGIKDFMVSWTLGGYPGGNLPLLSLSKDELMLKKFGSAAKKITEACSCFDRAFRYFPLNGTAQLYTAPQNFGPVNTLFIRETGYTATMIGFPYDDIKTWRGIYPEQPFAEAFQMLSELWQKGVNLLKEAEKFVPAEKKSRYADLLSVAEACSCHFFSTWLQIVFTQHRKKRDFSGMTAALQGELAQAELLLKICRKDSRIGFEASNHYYYNENTLLEKIFNCRHLINSRFLKARAAADPDAATAVSGATNA